MNRTDKAMELLPCPFCGSDETQIVENGKVWTGMKYSDPVSVSIRHWCEPLKGQPSRMIERIGKDLESAAAAWNSRARIEAMQRDCRTCAHFWEESDRAFITCISTEQCTNHDQWQAVEFKQLTRSE